MSIDKTIEAIKAMDNHTPLRGWDGHTVCESSDLQALIAYTKRLEVALRHYADEDSWELCEINDHYCRHYTKDPIITDERPIHGYTIAQSALDSKGKERE